MRGRWALVGVVAACIGGIALSVTLASARSYAGPTFAGVWNSDFGELTLDAGGSGSYKGFNPGTVSGSVKGSVDKGTWTQPGDPVKEGHFIFTLDAGGLTFTGTWDYKAGGCGTVCGWNGTCIGGPCLKNNEATTPATTTTATTAPGPTGKGDCSKLEHGRRLQEAASLKEVRVVCVVPDVQFHREGSPTTDWQTLEPNSVLQQGDEVSCDPDGMVVLAFADNSTVTVRNTTQLKIASFFSEGGVVRTQILLKMGEVAAKVNKTETTKSDFKIKSPTEVASVRGTVFTVFYDPGSKASITSVTRGVVAVDPTKPGLATAMVPAGKEVEVTATSISPKAPIGKADALGGDNRLRARDLVTKVIAAKTAACRLVTPRTGAFSVKPGSNAWLVSVKAIAGKAKGWSTWHVAGTKVSPLNATAKKIAGGCR